MLRIKMFQISNQQHGVMWRFEIVDGIQHLPGNTNFEREGYFDCQRDKIPAYLSPLGKLGIPNIETMCSAFELESGIGGRADWYMIDEKNNLILVSDQERLKRIITDFISTLSGSFGYSQFLFPVTTHYSSPRIEAATLTAIQGLIVQWIKNGAIAVNGDSMYSAQYQVINPQLL